MAIKFVNLAAAQSDVLNHLKKIDKGPADPSSLAILKKKLLAAKDKLPPVYQKAVYEPFLAMINQLTETDYKKVTDPNSNTGFIILDIAQAIIQNSEGYEADATDAFEEVVSDLYDGFLSAEDRHNIKLPDYEILPPLVKWGNPDAGPYTLPSDTTAIFNVNCAIVNLPPSHAHGAMMGWGCLGHETAGHDILHADDGLLDEMAKAVKTAIKADKQIKSASMRSTLASYWSARIDETASDLMGVLNLGPAAAAVIIPYFRGMLGAFGMPQKLRSTGDKDDVHPADILRVMLGASAVRLLSFKDKNDWADTILSEGLKDMTNIVLNTSSKIDQASAQRSADIVAKVVMQTEFAALKDHALQEIQDWADKDEQIVADLRKVVKNYKPTSKISNDAYATHVLAAAIYEGLLVKQDIAPLFKNLIKILKQMHNNNPSWGPLYILNPGDLKRDFIMDIQRLF
jgi:hypothetical protein